MAKSQTVHVCSSCGHEAARWHGQCPGCEEWNTLVEQRAAASPKGGTARAAGRPVALKDLTSSEGSRITTGIGELDRVLGGGLVPGSVVLLGGAPGIGKSTLTSMALGNIAGAGEKVLYVSAEESAEQIRLRALRLGEAALEVPVRRGRSVKCARQQPP